MTNRQEIICALNSFCLRYTEERDGRICVHDVVGEDTDVDIYYDESDPHNSGWAWRTSTESGSIDSVYDLDWMGQ